MRKSGSRIRVVCDWVVPCCFLNYRCLVWYSVTTVLPVFGNAVLTLSLNRLARLDISKGGTSSPIRPIFKIQSAAHSPGAQAPWRAAGISVNEILVTDDYVLLAAGSQLAEGKGKKNK